MDSAEELPVRCARECCRVSAYTLSNPAHRGQVRDQDFFAWVHKQVHAGIIYQSGLMDVHEQAFICFHEQRV